MKRSTCMYKNTFTIIVSDGLGTSTENGLCDGPASSSSPTSSFSLTAFAKAFLKADFHIHFFCLCTGASDTSTFCFSASAPLFVIRVELTTVSVIMAGAAAGPGVSLSDSETFFPSWGYWAVLGMAQQAWARPQHSAVVWDLPGCQDGSTPFPRPKRLLVFLDYALARCKVPTQTSALDTGSYSHTPLLQTIHLLGKCLGDVHN